MKQTVQEQTFDLLRQLGLTTNFGNPGSTEETFLQNFPKDFRYIEALQETSAVAAADGYAQATRTVGLVNVQYRRWINQCYECHSDSIHEQNPFDYHRR